MNTFKKKINKKIEKYTRKPKVDVAGHIATNIWNCKNVRIDNKTTCSLIQFIIYIILKILKYILYIVLFILLLMSPIIWYAYKNKKNILDWLF